MSGTLILGASGFLGPHLVASAFARAQEEATMADPFGPPVTGVARSVELAPRYTNPRDGARWRSVDLLVEGAVETCLDEMAPSTVVLAAALSRALACEQDPALAERMNAELPREVALACRARGLRFVHVSTDQVFGAEPAPKGGLTESDPVAPLQVYGRTKAAGEAAVLEAHPEALVVRLPLLYGDSGGRGLGASDSLLEAVEADQQPALFEDEFRTPMEVRNAADALLEAAHSDLTGLLHLAPKQRVSRWDLGIAILRAMGLSETDAASHVRRASRSDFTEGPARAEDVSLNAARAARALQTPLLGIRRGLDAALGIEGFDPTEA